MSITVVLQQMVIIFLLIGIGMILFRRKMLSEEGSKQISGLIINVTNPALLICSALEDSPKASLAELGIALAAYAAVFALLIGIGFLLPYILRVPKSLHYAYQMLTVFGNVGFIGIPLASAVLGSESLIFVYIFNLLFNTRQRVPRLPQTKAASGACGSWSMPEPSPPQLPSSFISEISVFLSSYHPRSPTPDVRPRSYPCWFSASP